MRFVAIDFETMCKKRSSVCEIGLAEIIDGRLNNNFLNESKTARDSVFGRFYVCPPTNEVDYWCFKTHGITYEKVAKCRKFNELWIYVDNFLRETKHGKTVILAHNYSMEKGCINACHDLYGTPKDYEYICTLELSRKFFPYKKNHTLGDFCSHVGVEFDENQHHGAGYDALSTAKAFIALKNRFHLTDEQFLKYIKRN